MCVSLTDISVGTSEQTYIICQKQTKMKAEAPVDTCNCLHRNYGEIQETKGCTIMIVLSNLKQDSNSYTPNI